MSEKAPAQFPPRFRSDVYPFIYPEKFKGSLQGLVTIITGKSAPDSDVCVSTHASRYIYRSWGLGTDHHQVLPELSARV